MSVIEFQGWPKTPRLFRDSVITEKIDGTNAAIGIKRFEGIYDGQSRLVNRQDSIGEIVSYLVYAQSRNRIITPESDNYGFAAWVYANANADSLVADLGTGLHFGEWWGNGIQRGYGLDHKRFSLFNTHKWSGREFSTENLDVVPILAQRTFDTEQVKQCLDWLAEAGSVAAPDFKPAEGVCVYHSASRQVFKALIENDQQAKSVTAGLRLVA